MAITWNPDPAIGVDIKLDETGDLAFTPSGDLDLVGNVQPADNVWQATVLRLLTTLGTYLFESGYGTKLRQQVGQPITDMLTQQIKTQITTTVLSDPRVKSILNLNVTQTTDPDGYQIMLSILTASSTQAVSGLILVSGA